MGSSNVERIKERLDIVDVIGSYVKLDRAGKNFKAKSPFTNERTPSFYVSPDRQLYYCFSSGKGGDMFTFVQEMEGVDFSGALKILADRAGITLERESGQKRDDRDRLLEIMEEAADFYQKNLAKNPEAASYIASRGINEKSITKWRLGLAASDWRTLFEHLNTLGYKEKDLLAAGLIKKAENGRVYDTFRNRIMFPISDNSGRVIAFSGRLLSTEISGKAPKYLNSPDTPLYNKSEALYGLHLAKTAIRRKDYAVLVEGQMDLVLSHQAGVENTVASSGTAITENHLRRIKQLSPRMIMAFDADEAGFKASNRTALLALKQGIEVKVALLPPGKDPADLVKEDPETWKAALRDSMHIIAFYIQVLREKLQEKDPRRYAQELSKRVLPYVAMLESAVERGFYVARIAEEADVSEEAVWDDLRLIEKKTEKKIVGEEAVRQTQKILPEDRIRAIWLWQKGLSEPGIDIQALEKRLLSIGGDEIIDKITKEVAGDKEARFLFEIGETYDTNEAIQKDLEELLLNLEINTLKSVRLHLTEELRRAEEQNNKQEAERILKAYQEISEKITKLRQS